MSCCTPERRLLTPNPSRVADSSGLENEMVCELAYIMQWVGWGTREQALEAMIRARDSLGLKMYGRVIIIEPVSGRIL